TIQPACLTGALGREHHKDGMAARLLVAAPAPAPVLWTDAEPDEEVAEEFGAALERVLALRRGADGLPVPLTLSPEAKALWIPFANECGERAADLTGDRAAAAAKVARHAARLVGLDHVWRSAGSGDGDTCACVIDAVSVEAGIT